ncbi:hypothetical protein [Vibrio sp. 10N.239.312.D08]|uniref:hypothetical protein n=1 Tax=Vibrio sp. 10N.239.312.D08 TaxID=3229978 RepID=UPI00354CC62D
MSKTEKTNPSISDIEVKAEVFRVIRAGLEIRPKELYKRLVTHLEGTGATNKQILKALTELAETSYFN